MTHKNDVEKINGKLSEGHLKIGKLAIVLLESV